MSSVLKAGAFLGLALVLLPSILYYGPGGLPPTGKSMMFAGTVIWFVLAFFGFRQNPPDVDPNEEHTPVA